MVGGCPGVPGDHGTTRLEKVIAFISQDLLTFPRWITSWGRAIHGALVKTRMLHKEKLGPVARAEQRRQLGVLPGSAS